LCYTDGMTEPRSRIDKPEPRWHTLLALIAVAGVNLALPRSLIVGPTWLLPVAIGGLLAPTIVSHRMGRHSLNHVLGIISNSVITIALIGSVFLLVTTIPSHEEPPLTLLFSGAELWITNVLVFSLWYWRLDDGGPTVRERRHQFGSTSFFFPQMQVERSERDRYNIDHDHWHPRFVDYLFIAFTQSSTFGPTDAPLLARWAKMLVMVQIFISLSIVILLISRAVGVM
jgi:hypothetical protein